MTKEKVKVQLESAEYVTITTDGWTSINNESYLSVTAHYIKNVQMESYLLECYKYDAKHTAQNLAEELKRVTREWGIQQKIVCVVSDNAANIVAAIRLTGWKHIPCFAHNLNLIVQCGLHCIHDISAKIKRTVEFFKRSPQAATKLKEMQEQLGEPVLSLKQDVVTRWNSTLDMFQRILEVQRSLISTVALNYPDLPQISNDDVNKITQLCEVLKVFKVTTEEMSSEKQVTASKVILLSQSLKRWCSSFVHNAAIAEDVRQMAEKITEALNTRFRNIEDNALFAEATILDPRFKSHGFKDKRCFEKCKQALIAFCEKHQPSQRSDVTSPPPPISEMESIVWGEFDETVSSFVRNPHPKSAAIIEVDKFLQEPMLPRKENPLVWWSERRQIYPSLYNLVKKRLCVVATSTPCERVFSKAGHTVTEKRNRLTGKRVSQILFLNANLRE
ncbi:E3 SUMO-protein ligase ZBED1-like [Periplaneta americana]|uniref:E3 SUMO-protein ligase ZBED1-like n=1 Tax=Periplaneta americana TaxID=6978 RepID=UPI0037E984DB